eukprot:TRINITY_DN10284_c0_g1_i1.p1 TRINITY_DN10284_c0_g1~~TRINITY_DN10284_c0_g1_i1.p1  ORF type:complete len:1360 (-),score=233.37 TRINITY_DN10284_c0_g1_i1:104-3970(-)
MAGQRARRKEANRGATLVARATGAKPGMQGLQDDVEKQKAAKGQRPSPPSTIPGSGTRPTQVLAATPNSMGPPWLPPSKYVGSARSASSVSPSPRSSVAFHATGAPSGCKRSPATPPSYGQPGSPSFGATFFPFESPLSQTKQHETSSPLSPPRSPPLPRWVLTPEASTSETRGRRSPTGLASVAGRSSSPPTTPRDPPLRNSAVRPPHPSTVVVRKVAPVKSQLQLRPSANGSPTHSSSSRSRSWSRTPSAKSPSPLTVPASLRARSASTTMRSPKPRVVLAVPPPERYTDPRFISPFQKSGSLFSFPHSASHRQQSLSSPQPPPSRSPWSISKELQCSTSGSRSAGSPSSSRSRVFVCGGARGRSNDSESERNTPRGRHPSNRTGRETTVCSTTASGASSVARTCAPCRPNTSRSQSQSRSKCHDHVRRSTSEDASELEVLRDAFVQLCIHMRLSCESLEEAYKRLDAALGDKPSLALLKAFLALELDLAGGRRDRAIFVEALLRASKPGVDCGRTRSRSPSRNCNRSGDCNKNATVVAAEAPISLECLRRGLATAWRTFTSPPPVRASYTPPPVRARSPAPSLTPTEVDSLRKHVRRVRVAHGRREASSSPQQSSFHASAPSLGLVSQGTISRGHRPSTRSPSPCFARLHGEHAVRTRAQERAREAKDKKAIEISEKLAQRTVRKAEDPEEVLEVANRLWSEAERKQQRFEARRTKAREEELREFQEHNASRAVEEGDADLIFERLHDEREKKDARLEKLREEKVQRQEEMMKSFSVTKETPAVDMDEVVDRLCERGKRIQKRKEILKAKFNDREERKRIQALDDLRASLKNQQLFRRGENLPSNSAEAVAAQELVIKRLYAFEQRQKEKLAAAREAKEAHIVAERSPRGSSPALSTSANHRACMLYEDSVCREFRSQFLREWNSQKEEAYLRLNSVHRDAQARWDEATPSERDALLRSTRLSGPEGGACREGSASPSPRGGAEGGPPPWRPAGRLPPPSLPVDHIEATAKTSLHLQPPRRLLEMSDGMASEILEVAQRIADKGNLSVVELHASLGPGTTEGLQFDNFLRSLYANRTRRLRKRDIMISVAELRKTLEAYRNKPPPRDDQDNHGEQRPKEKDHDEIYQEALKAAARSMASEIMRAADQVSANGHLTVVELQAFLGPGTVAGRRFGHLLEWLMSDSARRFRQFDRSRKGALELSGLEEAVWEYLGLDEAVKAVDDSPREGAGNINGRSGRLPGGDQSKSRKKALKSASAVGNSPTSPRQRRATSPSRTPRNGQPSPR